MMKIPAAPLLISLLFACACSDTTPTNSTEPNRWPSASGVYDSLAIGRAVINAYATYHRPSSSTLLPSESHSSFRLYARVNNGDAFVAEDNDASGAIGPCEIHFTPETGAVTPTAWVQTDGGGLSLRGRF